jgi:LysM domain
MTRIVTVGSVLLCASAMVAACDLAELDPRTAEPSMAVIASAPPSPSFVRPTPTPLPTFLVYIVRRGDTLTSIATGFGTKAQSLAYWNRAAYPSLDPESGRYNPNTIQVGWALRLIPNSEVDPEDLPPARTPSPTPDVSTSPSPS